MKNGRALSLLFASVVIAAPAILAAEEPAQPQYYLLHQELAKPSMLKEYEATTQEFLALVKAHRSAMPHFNFTALQSADFTYTYVLPLASLATLDAVNAEFGALAQAAGAKFIDLMKRGGAATEYTKEWVVARVPELSYQPAAPRLKPDEMTYFTYDIYYVMSGREPEAEALSREFLALFKAKNWPDGYRIFKPVIGPEMPAIIVEVGAKDAADYQAQDAKLRPALGPEGEALFKRAFAITRRFEKRSGWVRPDISLPPAPAAKK